MMELSTKSTLRLRYELSHVKSKKAAKLLRRELTARVRYGWDD